MRQSRIPPIFIFLGMLVLILAFAKLYNLIPAAEFNRGSLRVYIIYGVFYAIVIAAIIYRLLGVVKQLVRYAKDNPRRTLDLALYAVVGLAVFFIILFGALYLSHS